MAERLHPGVYIEEVPSGVRPIEGVSTSTACFIGKAEMGALNKAVLVTSLTEFQTKYGGFLNDSWLAHAVLQFFNNGGKKTYIVRIAGSGAKAASITLKDRRAAAAKTITISAANEGAWGNKLDIEVFDGPADTGNEFGLRVYRDRSDLNPPKPPLLLEAHENVSMDPAAPNFVEKVLSANSQFINAKVDAANLANAAGMTGTSRSGRLRVGNGATLLNLTAAAGATAGPPPPAAATLTSAAAPSTNPPADQRRLNINLNGDGPKDITIPVVDSTGAQINTGAAMAAAIQTAVRAVTASNPVNQAAYNNFTATFTGGNVYLLTSGAGGASSSLVVTDVVDATAPISIGAGQTLRFSIYVNGDGPHEVVISGPLANGAAIASAIMTYVRDRTKITPKRASTAPALDNFTASYENDTTFPGNPSILLSSGAPGASASVRVLNGPTGSNLAALLKLGATNTGTEIKGSAIVRPALSQNPTEFHLGDASTGGNVDAVEAGDDGLTPGANDYKAGLPPLDIVRDVNIVCIPGNGDPDVVATGVNYCTQRGDCFFIGDPDALTDTVAEAQAFVNGLTVKSSYGAVYYPWLLMTDPTGAAAQPIRVPPSGFAAGLYARIDARRGVWKAPAGTEANVGGAVGLAADTTDVQQDFLNPIGVNVIRSFPASGLVIWGARTLATRSDPEYRYIPVRRTAIFLEQSIYNGIQWAVFEPNDEPLWASLRLNIGAFMLLQFRAGAFQGKTASDAFFVKCDASTTSQADIDAGVVNILVGFAPLKPAEFVVLRITQIVKTTA